MLKDNHDGYYDDTDDDDDDDGVFGHVLGC